MAGRMGVVSTAMMRAVKTKKAKIRGISQYFFLITINLIISFIKSIILERS